MIKATNKEQIMYVETHPFPEFLPPNVKSLILGSFPPVKLTAPNVELISGSNMDLYSQYFLNKRNQKKAADLDFYYGSSNNMFWKVMSLAFDCELTSVKAIKDFLSDKQIGVTDIVEKCNRKPRKQKNSTHSIGSLDSDLEIIQHRDIVGTIHRNSITKVYCTSHFVRDHLLKICEKNIFALQGVELKVLPSPSPAFSRTIGSNKLYKSMIKEGLVLNTIEFRALKYIEIFKD